MNSMFGTVKRLVEALLIRYGTEEQRIRIFRGRGVVIGSGCSVYPQVNFGSEPYLITIGDRVRIGNGVTFLTHDGGTWVLRNRKEPECRDADLFGRIRVGNNVHIGVNSTILPGVTIGDNCVIGCGAMVTKDVPDDSVVAGVPARRIESVEEYYRKVQPRLVPTKHMSAEEKKRYLSERYQG